jgi:hypothetical protein
VVKRVVSIVEGEETVLGLNTFDPEEQGQSVPLDLLSAWDEPTQIWLAAYLAFHGAVLSPKMMSSLRKKKEISTTIKKVKDVKADASLAAAPPKAPRNNRAQRQRRRRATPAARGFDFASLESP